MTSALADPPAAPEVESMIARVAIGDQRAFEDLYDLLTSRVLAVARLVSRDAPAAEDAARRAWLGVWREAAQYDPAAGSGLCWVLGHAQRAAFAPRVVG